MSDVMTNAQFVGALREAGIVKASMVQSVEVNGVEIVNLDNMHEVLQVKVSYLLQAPPRRKERPNSTK